MGSKHVQKTSLKSMREFEKMYYPNNLSHKERILINDDEQFGKKFADETFTQIKKKYTVI